MQQTLKVSGMTCLDCSKKIVAALQGVEGVSAAHVDYRGGEATVESEFPISAENLVGAVQRAGYIAEVASLSNAAIKPDTNPSVQSSVNPPVLRRPTSSAPSSAPSSVPTSVPYIAPQKFDFDLLIIGTGGAGMAAAIQAVGMGAKVAIVEEGTLGGTCVNVGCIPSKNLIEVAAHYHSARAGFPGIGPCEPKLDWKEILKQKNDLIAELRRTKYADVLTSYPGLVVLRGRARLAGQAKVRIGDKEHSARKILIATGTSPSMPPIPGIEKVNALDSTSVMELQELPKSLLVLGGSAVGLELGQTFARFGSKVTIVEILPHLLANEDTAISEELRLCLEAEGIEIHTGVRVTAAARDDGLTVLDVTEGTLTGTLSADQLLVATGRKPNTTDMGLENAGVVLTERGFIRVDSTMSTSNEHIFAAGDVTGGPGYVYVAAAGGRVAAENAIKSLDPNVNAPTIAREFDASIVPNVTFTAPQVGSVGMTEINARRSGYNPQVTVLQMKQVPRALVSREKTGLVKIVADAATGKILGVHAVAPFAGELMGEAALAIRFGLTARDISGTLHPYLTWGESLKLAAQGFSMDISKLSCCA